MTAIRTKVTSEFANIAQYNSSTGELLGLNLPTTINASNANVGGMIVTANIQLANLSTSIGNGNINTGNTIAVGGANIADGEGSIKTQATTNGYWLQSFSNDGNLGHQFISSNSTGTGNSTFALAATGAGNILTANTTAITLPHANANLLVTRGQTALSSAVDEFIQVGGNTYNATCAIGLNSANSQFSGLRISRAGTQRWFMGADNSRDTGNLIIYGPPGGTYMTFRNVDNTIANAIITTTMSSRKYEARRTSTTYGAGINSVINFDAVDTNTIPNFTQSAGVFTNTSNTTRRFIFDLTAAFQATGTGFGECDIWFQQNSTGGGSGTARRGQIAYSGVASSNQMLSTSWTFELAAGDTVTCWAWAGTAWRLGAAIYGFNTDQSCRVHIAEVL